MKKKNSLFHILIMSMLVVVNVFSLPITVTLAVDFSAIIFTGAIFSGTRGSFNCKGVFAILTMLSLYSFVIALNANHVSTYTVGKPLRMLVVYSIFVVLARSMYQYKINEIFWGIVLAFSVHLSCVYIQFFFPSTKILFYELLVTYDNEAITELSLRAFGLCASFDMAGLCLCVLMTLLWIMYRRTRQLFLFVLSMTVLAGCFMVGRTSMVIGSTFFLLMLFSLFRNSKKYFAMSSLLFMIVFYYAWGYGIEIVNDNEVGQSYREESVRYLTGSMLYLPETMLETIFGTGLSATHSDIGYIKIIHPSAITIVCSEPTAL